MNTGESSARTIVRRPLLANNVIDDLLARRVYEICVAHGYVDSRDWLEAESQISAQLDTRSQGGQPPPSAGDQGAGREA